MKLFSSRSKASSRGPAPVPAAVSSELEPRIRAIGEEILRHARAHKAGLLSAKFYSDKMMDWTMKDENFKVQLFRFVDTFPVLTTPEMVHDHLMDYLTQPGVKLPAGMDVGLKMGGMAKGLTTKTIAGQIEGMGQKFIAGTDAESALPGLRKLWDGGIAFSVDLLGEACVSDAEADSYKEKYLDLVNNLPERVAGWPEKPVLERDHIGVVPRTNVSIKISSLSAKYDPIDPEGAISDAMGRLLPILEAAKARGVLINMDTEQADFKDLTLDLWFRACEAVDFEAGLAMQAYLKSGVEDAKRVVEWTKHTGRVLTVRLVKGAYWDYETIHAEQMGWPCPVWPEKWMTDRCFEQMAEIFLDSTPRTPGEGGVKLALGSHNARSIAAALAAAEKRDIPREAIELQMLHGMADQLKHAAAEMGLRIREYVPVGEMIPGMAYLVRRLLENTSNESWLKASVLDEKDTGVLLAPPAPKATGANGSGGPIQDLYEIAAERHRLSPAFPGVGDGKAFVNEPPRNFADRAQHRAFAEAVNACSVPDAGSMVGVETAEQMVGTAKAAFASWRDTDAVERCNIIVRAAGLMRQRRDELSGVMIKEAGKTWAEADADICEAIDFCQYYARCAAPMFSRERLGRFIGELDEQWYQPKGVAVVISPWNFPGAIFTGMVTAALVCGNTVIAKPAEQTPGIAKAVCDILWSAGVPRDVLHYCHARGETVGAQLVRDPRVCMVAFTGSKAVGLDIIAASGQTRPGQANVKKVVCEMGGKNAIIIDSSADLDEAVLGVRYSAFGFQGQKCSACSRCIVVDPDGPSGDATRLFMERLIESTRSLVIGDPLHPGTDVGPVIDAAAKHAIEQYIDQGRREATLELAMDVPEGLEEKTGRHYVAPHIFSGVTGNHVIGSEEIFGPVLGVFHARSFEEALEIANSSPYKLTGGVFTRKPAHIELAKRDFRVGNLYINQKCTGAVVARQPFGGAGMSGIGTKAGGKDYLMHFTDPRACCENTLRSGFAPEL
jgi:RHH-type proline utilization regulon transcriptional repressor/proline dehydrogenase/delta 1-pyrroline-5-carboxylate dehydrogenase